MSRPDPAAAAAGPSATKMPAPIIEPSPIVTASKVPSRRCNAGPAGVVTPAMLFHDCADRSGGLVFSEHRFATPEGSRDEHHACEHYRPHDHHRDRPDPAQHECRAALVDVVGACGGSGPTA